MEKIFMNNPTQADIDEAEERGFRIVDTARPFSRAQQEHINEQERKCGIAGCDDDGHKCTDL